MKYKIVSAHQPNFLPYIGFFDKMKKSDVLVIRDEVQFVKKEFHNRNKIRIQSNDPKNPSSKWINVPVIKSYDYILNIEIDNSFDWRKNLLDSVKVQYSKAPYFEKFFPEFEKIINKQYDKLISLNMEIIFFLCRVFDIKTKIIMASDLDLKPKK